MVVGRSRSGAETAPHVTFGSKTKSSTPRYDEKSLLCGTVNPHSRRTGTFIRTRTLIDVTHLAVCGMQR
jgi:hypothetical protein